MYLDYQSTTPVDPAVVTAMEPFWSVDFGNPHSSEHVFGWKSARAIETARGQVAALIQADEDEIIFTSGATEANNLALWGVLSRGDIKKLITTTIEHKSILDTAKYWRDQGIDVEYLEVDEQGLIDIGLLDEKVQGNKVLVSIIGVNNEIGTVQNIQEISKVVHTNDGILHIDGSQMPACIDIDVFAMGIDLLSLSSHKIYGPKGIGALFLSRDLQETFRPMMFGGGQELGLRSGTLATPLVVGFGVASAITLSQSYSDRGHISGLTSLLYTGLKAKVSQIQLNGPDWKKRHPGNLNIYIPKISSKTLLEMLQPSLAASTGSACMSGVNKPSYVLRAIGLNETKASQSLRLSVGRFTTEQEVRDAIDLIVEKIDIVRHLT